MNIRMFKQKFDLIGYVEKNFIHEWRGHRLYALCPFHIENTPSLLVDENNRWYCFGCGRGGDAIDFLTATSGMSISEILNGNIATGPQRKTRRKKKGKIVLPERAIERMEASLWKDEDAIGYLKSRGLNEMTIRQFRVGLGRPDYWKDPDRIVIPFYMGDFAITAKLRKIPGRHDERDKYMSWPNTKATLFNFGITNKYNSLVLAGSQIDAMLLNQYGIPAIGSYSESVIPKEQEEALRDKEVFVLFDNDECGLTNMEILCGRNKKWHPVYWDKDDPPKYDVGEAILDRGMQYVEERLRRSFTRARFVKTIG